MIPAGKERVRGSRGGQKLREKPKEKVSKENDCFWGEESDSDVNMD